MEGKIIKGSGAAQKIVKHEVYSAGLEARDIVESARAEAQTILARAEGERQKAIEEARLQGYEEGLSRWNEIVAEALSARDKLVEGSEQDLVKLAVRIAGKIIGEKLEANPETIVSLVREALRSVHRERSLTIQVNPQHYEQVRANVDKLLQHIGGSREIRVASNPSIEPGGCVVESEIGVIDARLETQLKCLEQALLRAATR